jgi:hypothetical protein
MLCLFFFARPGEKEQTQSVCLRKLHDIRTYSGHPNDWPSTYADSALLNIITREIAFSQYLMDACAWYTSTHMFGIHVAECIES